MTIFYKGKLKRTRTPEDVFQKIKVSVKPKGITKLWTIQDSENCLVIDFGDNTSDNLVFDFKDKLIDGFCKTCFEGVSENENAVEHGEKQLEAVFKLFYSIIKMFSTLEISDDYGLWDDFIDSKRYKIQIRELTKDETTRVKTLYDLGFVFYQDLIWKMIADDLGIPHEKLHSSDFICSDRGKNRLTWRFYRGSKVPCQIFAKWLDETSAYKEKGRLCNMSVEEYYGNSEVSEVEFAVDAFVSGCANLFLADFIEYKRHGCTFGPKHGQAVRLFEDKFLPLFNAETDAYKQCILAYRYVVSVYDYAGFKFLGKME